jgi:CRP/FNR family transcriptional regulator, cyclic AMP receptor protein
MISAAERLEFLRRIPVLAGLDETGLKIFADHAQEISCPAGMLAVHEGDPGNQMFVIYSGRVEVIKRLGEPNEHLLTMLGPRDHFGEMCIIECVARSASVRALEDTVLFGLKGADLFHLFKYRADQYAILILNLARDLSRRLRALEEKWKAVSH